MNRGSKWKDSHTKVIRKILKMAEKGTNVVWIQGNHDDFLDNYMGLTLGNITIKKDLIYKGADKRLYYIFHGDVLDVFSSKFKLIAKIGSIGYDFALWLNRIYKKYRELRKLKNAVLLSKQKKCDVAVCGHIHKVELCEKYMNSGDWCESCTALVEDYDGKWSIINFHLTI